MTQLLFALFMLVATSALAQPEVDASRIYLGPTGSVCTLRVGTGAPGAALGSVCDLYHQQDAPYTIFVKTGASTWTQVLAIDGVAAGSVLASNGVGVPPVYTASPSLTSIGGASNLTLNPAGDVVFNPTGNDLLPTTGYDLNIGALTNKFLTLHAAELWVETLVAQNTIATIGGRVLVGPTTTLTADLAAAATSIQVKHNQIANGDRLVMQANGSLEWLAVTSGASGSAGAYVYSVTRNLDGSGANDWTAGDAVFNSGTTGDGYIDLYSVNGLIPGSTVGPTIVGNVRTGTTYSNVEPRWAIGNLNGLYGYATDTYGSAFGDAANANITIDATNGIRIRDNATNLLHASAAGALTLGNPAGNRLVWNGTTLEVVSANLTIDGSGVRIAPSTTYADARAYGFTTTTGTLGLYGADGGGAGIGRSVNLEAGWTGTGNLTNGVHAVLAARHSPSSGGTTRRCVLDTVADGSSAQLTIDGCLSVVTDAAFSSLSGNGLTIADRLIFSTDTTVGAGAVGQTTTDGLKLRGVAGSSYDLALYGAADTPALVIFTGTNEVGIAGVAFDGTGKVVCVKSNQQLGTCTNAPNGSGVCTCG